MRRIEKITDLRGIFSNWLVFALAILSPGQQNDSVHEQNKIAQKILEGARGEAKKHTLYIEQYKVLAYLGGDVPASTGVCTDLIIRACRNAGLDLQQALHEDRKASPAAYPTHIWKNKKPDRNIDHRRCQNLTVWFRRFSEALPIATDKESLEKYWRPGDVVFYIRKGQSHPWHVAIVSDQKEKGGMPRIIDSYPPWTSESHRLDEFAPIHSHFRLTEIPPRRQSEK